MQMPKPNIFYFNPTCELAVANGSFSYMPPLLLQEMEKDLAILPFVFGTATDFIITENHHSSGFIEKLRNLGFDLPEFRNLSDLEKFPEDSFASIQPWGWSPVSHFKLKFLKKKCIENYYSNWDDKYKSLFERETSLNLLRALLKDKTQSWIINESMTGLKIQVTDDIESLLLRHKSLVLKAPLSSSGRGIQIIRKNKLNTANKQWISGVLKQQKYLVAEPLLEKIIDLSFQFKILPEMGIEYLGYSIFETNSNGQYNGTLLHSDLALLFPEENSEEIFDMIVKTAKMLQDNLQNTIYSKLHRGFLGVDAMLFRHENKIKMQPCIEINSRMNMGILSKVIEEKIHLEAKGKFKLFYGSPGEYLKFISVQSQLNPIQMKDGKLISGFLSLTEPYEKTKFGAYISLETAK